MANESGLAQLEGFEQTPETPDNIQIAKQKLLGGTVAGVSNVSGNEVLKNMQNLIDQKYGGVNSFLNPLVGGLKDAASILNGTMNQRDAEKRAEGQQLLEMQNAMTIIKGQQLQQKQDADFVTKILTGHPEAKGQTPDSMTAERMRNARDATTARQIYDDSLKTQFNEQQKFLNNPSGRVQAPYRLPSGEIKDWSPVQIAAYERSHPEVVGQQPTTPSVPTSTISGGPGINPQNIGKVESNNTLGAIGPYVPGQGTAKSSMQVMDATALNPGYGVKPAQLTGDPANDEAESKRVGIEYFNALKAKHGDTLAAAAYAWGPGKLEAWLASGADISKLPPSVRDYIGKAHVASALQQRQQVPTQAASSNMPDSRNFPNTAAYTAAMKVWQEGQATQAQEQSKANVVLGTTIRQDARTSGERMVNQNAILNLLNDPDVQGMVGRFQTGDQSAAFIRQMQSGIEAGNFGSIGLKELQQNLAKRNASPEAIRKFSQLESDLKQNELDWSKNYLKGQGAVSDNERRLVQEAIGSVNDPIGKLKTLTATMKERAQFDAEVGKEFKTYKKQYGNNASMDDFLDSDQYTALNNDHNTRLATILNKNPSELQGNTGHKLLGEQSAPAKPATYSDPEKEKRYQDFLKRQGK